MAAQTAYQSLQDDKESESASFQEMMMSVAKEFEVGHCYTMPHARMHLQYELHCIAVVCVHITLLCH